MKCNLAGLLTQAAACIDPERDTGAYAYMLSDGTHTLQEFADFYCMNPDADKHTTLRTQAAATTERMAGVVERCAGILGEVK